MNNLILRKERIEDYKATELMVRRAFWNIHGPGCNEHLFAHKLRMSEEYLPDISRVAELDGKIVGVIMYSKAKILSDDREYDILTFGPLAVEPTAHSLGIGGRLMEETFKLALEKGYPGICICGEPEYYPKHGFSNCDKYGITDMEGNNYDALMGIELYEGAFNNIKGKFKETDLPEQCEDEEELMEFDRNFPAYKKLKLKCQWLNKEKLGQISEVSKDLYTIRFWEMELPARLSERFAKEGLEKPIVGDYVTFYFNPHGDSQICEVCEESLRERNI